MANGGDVDNPVVTGKTQGPERSLGEEHPVSFLGVGVPACSTCVNPCVPAKTMNMKGVMLEKIQVLDKPEDAILSYAFTKLSTGEWAWRKHEIGSPDEGVCLVGAIHYAAIELGLTQEDNRLALRRVESIIQKKRNRAGLFVAHDAPSYNDRDVTKKRDILGVLEKALATPLP